MTQEHLRSEPGQTMAEYAVVLGVISAATVGIFAALAGATHGLIDAVLSAVSAIP